MGVPRLFKYILDNFPSAIKHFERGNFTEVVDYLYLDANGLLHQAAQLVYNYGEMKRRINTYRNLSENAKRLKVYQLFFQNILQVIRIISPRKVLYIAIDGPAPLSKQAQQRQRRFVAARTRLKEQEETGGTRFDSNSITPGTIFMHQLTRYMHYAIRKEMNTYPAWRGVKVYFSPATVPSEGEHKVMDFIRSLPDSERTQASHCLFGPDGDLIMLTLAAHIPRMFLFREDQYEVNFYHYLDMGQIRRELAETLGQLPGVNSYKRDLDDVTDDFIVGGFFVGNDFLPKIQMFYLLEDGLETMMRVYAQTSNRGCQNFLTVGNHLSLPGFRAFIKVLETYEKDYLRRQSKVKVRDSMFINHTLLQHIKKDLQPGERCIRRTLDFSSYRESYYLKTIGPDFSPEDIQKMCQDYLKSFLWILEYYVHGLPSWEWAYRWHYAPLMRDFSLFLQGLSQEDFKNISTFKMKGASLPFVQLLSVLPPSSARLLPPSYRKLMKPKSVLSKLGYYPCDFEIDYEGKIKEYQGIAILPFVNHDQVKGVYSKVSTTGHLRNGVGRISLFHYDPKFCTSFTSDMGNILELHVRKFLLPPHRL